MKSKIKLTKLEKYKVLLVDNMPQSVYPLPDGGYWKEMIPPFEVKNALILGLGGGTIARMLKQEYPNVKITAVESNPEMIAKAKKYMELDELGINVVNEDAYEFIKNCKDHFDYICVDFWTGRWVDSHIASPDFILQLKALLEFEGYCYINLPNYDFMIQSTTANAFKTTLGGNAIYYWQNNTN